LAADAFEPKLQNKGQLQPPSPCASLPFLHAQDASSLTKTNAKIKQTNQNRNRKNKNIFKKYSKKTKIIKKNQADSSGENQKSKIKKNQLKKHRNSLIVIKIRCSGLFLSPCIQASFQI
jgi:hypothetical protein